MDQTDELIEKQLIDERQKKNTDTAWKQQFVPSYLFNPIRRDEPVHQEKSVGEQGKEGGDLNIFLHNFWKDG